MTVQAPQNQIKIDPHMDKNQSLIQVDNTEALMGSELKSEPSSRRQRTIRFAPYDDVTEIPHIDEMPQEEVDALWITHDEFHAMREECIQLVELIEASMGTSYQIDFDIRGLDQHVQKYKQTREAIQQLQYETVFRIKAIQAQDGKDYTDFLAQLCQTCTSSSVSNAIAIGLGDARAVNSSETLA